MTFNADIEMAQDGRVRMIARMAGPEGNMTFESVVSEPDIYVKMPEAGWVRMSGGAVDGFLDQSLSAPDIDLLGGFFPAGDEAWDLFSVKSLGREWVDNVEAEHLRADVDFQKLWDQQLNESGQFFGSVFPEDLTAELMQEVNQQVEMGIELWVDDEGYTRRTKIDMNFGDVMSMVMDMRVFDFNEKIAIQLPRDYSEAPLNFLSN